MLIHRRLVPASAAAIFCLTTLGLTGVNAAAQRLTVPLAGTSTAQSQTTGGDAITNDEFPISPDAADDGNDSASLGVNRTIATSAGQPQSAHAGKKAKSNPELVQTAAGLNFFDQRYANNGNQFSVEPPDQALCVGNGYVVEATNDVFKVLSTSGTPIISRMDLNTLFGYPAAIDRSNHNLRGPSITDPVCLFDNDTKQFYLAVLTFDVVPATGRDTGRNHLDIAVTTNGDPSGTWRYYHVPTQNDGTEGTPDHGCPTTVPSPRPASLAYITNPNACFADYPHIGADANGLYLSTNEFPLFAGGFHSAVVYALSKRALGRGDASVGVSLLDTLNMGPDGDGFTVWPAQAPAGGNVTDNAGTEYFMSSRAVFTDTGYSDSMLTWAVTNTASLDTASPNLQLTVGATSVLPYAIFQRANQKAGSIPLGQCTADPTPIYGPYTCAQLLGARQQTTYSEALLNANDSRIQQVFYANGKLWGSLDTGLIIDGDTAPRAGIAYYILVPQLSGTSLKAKVANQGYIGVAGNNVTYPSIAALGNGRGVISYTLAGNDNYPSVGYSSLDPVYGAGDVHVALPGVGPQDGFTGYAAAFSSPRPRWGDYGAAAVDGDSIWFAQEYIGQTCTYNDYLASSPFGSCGGTRGALGNWGTGIAQVKLK